MRLARNGLFSAVQVLTSTVSMLLAYRQISTRLGVAELGVWSVINAIAASGKIADLGAGRAIVRLLPPVLMRGDRGDGGKLIATAFSLVAFTLVLILPIAFPFLLAFTGVFVTAAHVDATKYLLILSLSALVLNAGAACFLGALEAMQRYDLRFVSVFIANIVFIVVVLALAPTRGLGALALGVVAQALVAMMTSWLLVRSNLQIGMWFPVRVHMPCVRNVVATGGPLQVVTLANLAFEPTSRLLMARFGGLEWAAIFDVTEKIVAYCRTLLMAALQVTTPGFARLLPDEREKRKDMYRVTYRLAWSLGVVGFGAAVAALPALGIIALGKPHLEVVIIGTTLSAAWLLNTMSAPAYFSLLGGGRLIWIVAAHVVLAAANLGLGLSLGADLGAKGVIAAFVLALVVGSALNLAGHHRQFGYSVLSLPPRELGLFGGVSGILLAGIAAQAWADSMAVRSLLAAGFSIGVLVFGAAVMRITLIRLWNSGAQRAGD